MNQWQRDLAADIASGAQAVIDDWPTPEVAASMQFEADARALAERYRFNPVTLAWEGDRRVFGSMATTLAARDAPLFRRAYLISIAHQQEKKEAARRQEAK